MIPTSSPLERDIITAKGVLDYARLRGDLLKIELAEDALNALLDTYTYHGYHESLPKEQNEYHATRHNSARPAGA